MSTRISPTRRPRFSAPVLMAAALLSTSTGFAADPVADLASFSVFNNVDIADLAKADPKTMHGPPMNGRYLSVQSCYVSAGSPDQQVAALQQWDPSRHRELKVFLHGDLPASPSPSNFSRLKTAPDNGPVHALVAATQKMSRDLQLSRDEASRFKAANDSGGGLSGPVGAFWMEVLTGRAKSFVSGGTGSQQAYDHAGAAIRPNDEVNSLLKQQAKIRSRFADFLGDTGIGRNSGGGKPELYWELVNVEDQAVLTLGASYVRGTAGGGQQTADLLYYASGGYYVALTLYQMWPVTVEGKASTLVWRGDLISSASLESLHGVERLGSESAMMKDISKTISLLRADMSRSR